MTKNDDVDDDIYLDSAAEMFENKIMASKRVPDSMMHLLHDSPQDAFNSKGEQGKYKKMVAGILHSWLIFFHIEN